MKVIRYSWIFLVLTLPTISAKDVKPVYIKDCEPGKYFWQEKKPSEFYACLMESKKAVKMQCAEGSFMCNMGEEMFMPCSCIMEDDKLVKKSKKEDRKSKDKSDDFLDQLVSKSVEYPADIKYDSEGKGKTDKFAKSGAAGLHKLDDPGSSNAVDSNDIPSNRRVRQGDDLSLPADGCPNDDFKLVKEAHMFKGEKVAGSLLECQQLCLGKDTCMGVDWNRVEKQCFYLDINTEDTIKYGLSYHQDTDHYRRTHCYSTIAPYGRENVTPALATAQPTNDPATLPPTTQPQSTTPPPTTQAPTTTQAPSTTPPPTTTQPTTTDPNTQPPPTTTQGANTREIQAGQNEPAGYEQLQGNNFVPTTTTTFPDSGCPFTLAKYIHTSHPFGIEVPNIITMEDCKLWCIKYSFCKGVDFSSAVTKCYYLRDILPDKLTVAMDVTHFRKIDCAPPLRCWSEDKMANTEEDLSVYDANTPQTACQGVCFSSQTLSSKGTAVQRGCMTITDPKMPDVPLGCSVDSTLMTIVCFCSTDRCNGFSISAQAGMMLYMPLDGDFRDYSGIGRDGVIPTGKTKPAFSCLDKAVNCSAMFDGSSCIAVNSMAQVQWGLTDFLSDDFIPSATFCLWFKRATTKNSMQMQGIFGNSLDTTQPSFQFIAEMMDNFIGAGISTASNSALDDYPWQAAANDEWHLACLTYDGVLDTAAKRFPLLQFYIDGVKLMGNSRADRGEIGVRSQPVTIGCVQEMSPFIGFLDEVRIFNMELQEPDLKAMMVMREPDIYW